MSYRYIGSKARLADQIIDYIGAPKENSGRFIDAFAGTGVVAEKAATNGWKIRINDMMLNSVLMAEARLLSKEDINFYKFGGYKKVIHLLNNLLPQEGYIWRNYSPASIKYCNLERKYFTEENAKKIDAVTQKIHSWYNKKLITHKEFALLITNLISSTNDVANIAGTYGCFLSKWTSQSQKEFQLSIQPLKNKKIDFQATNNDVFNVTSNFEDIVYLDPPYTKRQYASYYHIPETLSVGDEPLITGVAGLRPWKDKASVFCYKRKALNALTNLILQQKAHRVLISYSNEGHISLDDLCYRLSSFGNVNLIKLGTIGRYRPNKVAVKRKADVREYLLDFRRRN